MAAALAEARQEPMLANRRKHNVMAASIMEIAATVLAGEIAYRKGADKHAEAFQPTTW